MTRLQRKRRRQWTAVYVILSTVILTLCAVIAFGYQTEEPEVIHEPELKPIAEIKAEIATRTDHPTKFYYRQDIPLDHYTQETLYNAAMEWGVPYELAVAVCWRETNFMDLVTTNDTGVYYGMMAVQKASAQKYMELCGVDHLNSMEERLRVGCCILGEHIANYGVVRGLMAFNAGANGAAKQWAVGIESTVYTQDIMRYMEALME